MYDYKFTVIQENIFSVETNRNRVFKGSEWLFTLLRAEATESGESEKRECSTKSHSSQLNQGTSFWLYDDEDDDDGADNDLDHSCCWSWYLASSSSSNFNSDPIETYTHTDTPLSLSLSLSLAWRVKTLIFSP